MFWDENGFSLRPFIHAKTKYRGADTNFRWIYKVDTEMIDIDIPKIRA